MTHEHDSKASGMEEIHARRMELRYLAEGLGSITLKITDIAEDEKPRPEPSPVPDSEIARPGEWFNGGVFRLPHAARHFEGAPADDGGWR